MEETTFFTNATPDNISVTNARFMVNGDTYIISNMTSVKTATIPPKRTIYYVIIFFALLLCLGADGNGAVIGSGLSLIALMAYWAYKTQPEYIVVLATSAGELKALKSFDKKYIENVIKALNDAIVHRG